MVEGLESEEAARRLAVHGPNILGDGGKTSWWQLIRRQLDNPMVGVLSVACGVAVWVGELVDAVAIATIVALDLVVGVAQEARAETAILALRRRTAPRARVRRDGRRVEIPAREVVPGDVLELEAGDVVAADGDLIEVHRLQVDEAMLTGESLPIGKRVESAPEDAPLAEQHHRVFLGTQVVEGAGLARVTGTGRATEMGHIATLLEEVTPDETPLQIRLRGVTRALVALCLVVVSIVSVSELLRGRPWVEVMLVSVSLAVAAVPEGLPAVVTIALAMGVQRMAARQVLVRRLPAVEALGSAGIVCTDKTGTLTTGQMTVREVVGPRREILAAAAGCSDASLSDGSGLGDPTEIALLHAASELGIHRAAIERDRPRVEVEPFSSSTRRMSVLRADGIRYVKGAPEVLLSGEDEGWRAALEGMAERGLRVLAVGIYPAGEDAFRCLGLVGLADPPRPEAIRAVAAARRAGIRTLLVTGDNAKTAEAIAREMGILQPGESAEGVIYARASPRQKLDLVRAWKERGEVVAMTGDGVNDAPAIREAHVGIAMGRTGTEVTREAADIVLADDNYASIIAAIQEGRGIYQNIRKTLVYLLAGNVAELGLMFGASLLGLPSPLGPLQLLWINLVTDGLPALALVTDPPDVDVLAHPPRPLEERMLGPEQWRRVVGIGLLDVIVVLVAYRWVLAWGTVGQARTLAFTALVFCEVLRVFAARSVSRLYWEVGALNNVRLIAVVLGTVCVQLLLLNTPWLRWIFDLVPLSGAGVVFALGLGFVPVTVLEGLKLFGRRGSTPKAIV